MTGKALTQEILGRAGDPLLREACAIALGVSKEAPTSEHCRVLLDKLLETHALLTDLVQAFEDAGRLPRAASTAGVIQ